MMWGMAGKPKAERAARARVSGRVQGVGFREAAVREAETVEIFGWVRNEEDGTVAVHAEGDGEGGRANARFPPRGATGGRR